MTTSQQGGGSPAPWLQYVVINDTPMPAIGKFLTAKNGIAGLVVGYHQSHPKTPMSIKVQDVGLLRPVLVLIEDILAVDSVEDLVAGQKPRLTAVSS